MGFWEKFVPKRATDDALVWITDRLAVGAAPLSEDALEQTRAAGIDAILNLCAEFSDLHTMEAERGFEVHYLPVIDEEAPDLAALEKALAWLDECVYLGKKVLIHCRHGIGRTGTVLNAYLLRRGLGHRRAARLLSPLRSQPASNVQWRTVRRYGKAHAPLSVREPSLASDRLVDLTPFFADYARLCDQAEDLYIVAGPGDDGNGQQRCGREHDTCSSVPVRLHLIESAHLRHRIDTTLGSEQRLGVIERAVDTAKKERALRAQCDPEQEECCLLDADAVCPLLGPDGCMVYHHRPMQCRTWDLPGPLKTEFWDDVLSPALARLSEEMFFALASRPVPRALPTYALPDVASGRYVQDFFHFLLSGS